MEKTKDEGVYREVVCPPRNQENESTTVRISTHSWDQDAGFLTLFAESDKDGTPRLTARLRGEQLDEVIEALVYLRAYLEYSR